MRQLVLVLALGFVGAAYAEDGLMVRFTIKRFADGNATTYTSGVLIKLREAVSFTIPNQYELRLESQPEGSDRVNLVVGLKTISTGKPIYAGSGATTLKVGQSTTLELHQLPQAVLKYEVHLDTSYGQLPASR